MAAYLKVIEGCVGRTQSSVSPPPSRPLLAGTAVSSGWEHRRDRRPFGWSGRFAQRPSPARLAQHSPARGDRAALDSFFSGCPAAWLEGSPAPFLLCLMEGVMRGWREREVEKSALCSSTHPSLKACMWAETTHDDSVLHVTHFDWCILNMSSLYRWKHAIN